MSEIVELEHGWRLEIWQNIWTYLWQGEVRRTSEPFPQSSWDIGPFDERDAVVASAKAIVAKLED